MIQRTDHQVKAINMCLRDSTTHGYLAKCFGCTATLTSRGQQPHSVACRHELMEAMANDQRAIKSKDSARHTFPAFVYLREHIRTLACTHARSAGFSLTLKLCSLEKKLCHRHVDDRIHMHFHDSPSDTQHHSTVTYEVSLVSTTPLRNPSDPARKTRGCQAELPSTSYEPNLHYEDTTLNLYDSITSEAVPSATPSSETQRLP